MYLLQTDEHKNYLVQVIHRYMDEAMIEVFYICIIVSDLKNAILPILQNPWLCHWSLLVSLQMPN
jgi:hypothetical protein